MKRLDVEQMLDELSWDQFCGWLADYEQNRWGEERADLRTGSILSLYFNSRRKDGVRPLKPADFVSMFNRTKHEAPKTMTKEQFRSAFDGFKEMVKATAG